jgi:defect in organelle trafficking protein DotD
MLKIKPILTILFTLSLVGCSSDSKKVVDLNLSYMTADSAPVKTDDAKSQAQIAEAATSINQSLSQLSEMQQATHPDVAMDTPINAKTTGMTEVTSIDFNGTLEDVLKNIASMSSYQLKIIGNPPSIPVIINIHAKNQILADILRNVSYQAAKQATIKVYADDKTIELRYHSY